MMPGVIAPEDQYFHVILATKGWEPIIKGDFGIKIRERLVRNLKLRGAEVLLIQPAIEHFHILLRISAQLKLSEVVGWAKGECSHWANLLDHQVGRFYWQRGYFHKSVDFKALDSEYDQISDDAGYHQAHTFSEQMKQLRETYKFD